MNVRRPPSVPPRPKSSVPAGPAFAASTAGWYAEWKARKQSAPAAAPAPEAARPDDAAEALAKWLTGDAK